MSLLMGGWCGRMMWGRDRRLGCRLRGLRVGRMNCRFILGVGSGGLTLVAILRCSPNANMSPTSNVVSCLLLLIALGCLLDLLF